MTPAQRRGENDSTPLRLELVCNSYSFSLGLTFVKPILSSNSS
jgi:hypothetical protein